MSRGKAGRPRGKLDPAEALITTRVRRFIDFAHEGNVQEAARVSGLSYATLRDLYTGKSSNPGIKTLERLALAYGFYGTWFTDPSAPDAVPMEGGIELQEKTQLPSGLPYWQSFTIPFMSWPLPDVYHRLVDHLVKLPRSPDRPIIGNLDESDQTDRYEIGARVGRFLLEPYQRLEREGMSAKQPPEGGEWTPELEDERKLKEVKALRKLGEFWRIALLDWLGE